MALKRKYTTEGRKAKFNPSTKRPRISATNPPKKTETNNGQRVTPKKDKTALESDALQDDEGLGGLSLNNEYEGEGFKSSGPATINGKNRGGPLAPTGRNVERSRDNPKKHSQGNEQVTGISR